MKKTLLIILTFGLFSTTVACVCKWFTTDESRQGLFDKSEVVFKGEIIEEIKKPDSKTVSRIGLIKVTKAYKGCQKNDTICVMQNYYSNCSNGLPLKESLIFFSNQINKKVAHSDTTRYCKLLNKTLTFHSVDSSFTELINNRNTYKTVISSQCTMFYKDKEMSNFLKNKTK